jgi:hypothetical protein
MSITDREEPLEARIRNAVTAGAFAKADALWAELGAGLRHELAAGPVPTGRLQETLDLIEWCRTMALVDRARCQQRLDQLGVSSRYLGQFADPQPHLLARG